MDLKELSILILAIAGSLSCLGISFQIMKLLGAVTENVRYFRKSVYNLGILLEGLVKDQKLLSKGIGNFVEAADRVKTVVSEVSDKIMRPIAVISSFLATISEFFEGIKSRYLGK